MARFLRLGVLPIVVWVLGGCAGARSYNLRPPLWEAADRDSIPLPQERDVSEYYDFFENTFLPQLERGLSLPRYLRRWTGHPHQSRDVNSLDEVVNSTWYTNRHYLLPMTPGEIARGPNTGIGPDTSGVWTVTRGDKKGVTPGFWIRDPAGQIYILKFDPPGYPELSSAAEVVSTKLFYAAGYNVPENFIVSFRRDRLQVGEEARFTTEVGVRRPMTGADLEGILEQAGTWQGDRYRALASKFLPGVPRGQFSYVGRRGDDPNDLIPHEDRRSLRALRVLAAWLNHVDTRTHNTMDMYQPQGGYLVHYLIDFGSTLGSSGDRAKFGWEGYEAQWDNGLILRDLLTFGFLSRAWDERKVIRYPSVGQLRWEDFEPGAWKPYYPNPAFQNLTSRDGYWGAKIVTSFGEEDIRAAVASGQLSDPAAEAYLVRALVERRDRMGRYWFRRVAPLDRFALEGDRLRFVDLAVTRGLESGEGQSYQYATAGVDPQGPTGGPHPVDPQVGVPLVELPEGVTRVDLRKRWPRQWSPPVRVFIWRDGERLRIVGITRED